MLGLLNGAAHEGPLVLAVQQAEVSEGLRGWLSRPAPVTFGGRGAQIVPQLADEGGWGISTVL